MRIVRVPLRVSFIGGGTDLPELYQVCSGGVVSMAISKYVYVIVNKRDPIFTSKYRISYRDITEYVSNISDIQHDFIRYVMSCNKIDFPIEVITVADITGRGSGLGSSSAVLNGCIAGTDFEGLHQERKYIADESFRIERMYRKCGKQDHYATALGGIRSYKFNKDGTVDISNSLEHLCGPLIHRMFLVYTGILSDKTESILNEQSLKIDVAVEMNKLTSIFLAALDTQDYKLCYELIDESWKLKMQYSPDITNDKIDDMMELLRENGASGMKILGSGGGGFILGFHSDKNELRSRIPLDYFDVSIDNQGLVIERMS